VQMVKGKLNMVAKEIGEGVPFVEGGGQGSVGVRERVAEKVEAKVEEKVEEKAVERDERGGEADR
jgi:hypothetical protein